MVKFGAITGSTIPKYNPNDIKSSEKKVNINTNFSDKDYGCFVQTRSRNQVSSSDLIEQARSSYGNEYAAVNSVLNSSPTSETSKSTVNFSAGVTMSAYSCDTIPPIQISNEVSIENAQELAKTSGELREKYIENGRLQDALQENIEPMQAAADKISEDIKLAKEDLSEVYEESKKADEEAKNATESFNKADKQAKSYENKLNSKKVEYEKAQNEVKNAESDVASTEQSVNSAEGDLSAAQSSLSELEASLNSASDEEKPAIETKIAEAKKRVADA